MYNPDTELLFPQRVIPDLRDLRDGQWADFVDLISEQDPASEGRMAFELLMIRLCGCLKCNADSYRATKGCTVCAQNTIQRFRKPDEALINQFEDALGEIRLKR